MYTVAFISKNQYMDIAHIILGAACMRALKLCYGRCREEQKGSCTAKGGEGESGYKKKIPKTIWSLIY